MPPIDHSSVSEVYLSRKQQAERYSSSVKTIDRWGKDPRMNMPLEYQFGVRFLRKLSALERWERTRVGFPRGAQAQRPEIIDSEATT